MSEASKGLYAFLDKHNLDLFLTRKPAGYGPFLAYLPPSVRAKGGASEDLFGFGSTADEAIGALAEKLGGKPLLIETTTVVRASAEYEFGAEVLA